MSRRELIFLGIILLLVGLLGGIALASFGGDDEPDTEAADATSSSTSSSTTTEAPATTSTTSSTTTSTTSTTTSTTTTTTEAPVEEPPPSVAVVADLINGEVMGLPHGTLIDEVEFLMYEVFDAPDFDSGWNEGCPFDGAGDNERQIHWEGLWLSFRNETGTPILDAWRWRPTNPIPEGVYPANPQPDLWQIWLHDDVTPDMTMSEIGAAVGIPPVEMLGFSVVTGGDGWAYLSPDGDDNVPFEITSRLRFCD